MRVSHIFTVIILIISLVVQSHSSFDVIRFAGAKPDLLFIAITYFSYSFGSFYGEICAFFGGLAHDGFSNAPLGLLTLPKVIVAFAVGLLGRGAIRSNFLTNAALLFVASIVKGIITMMLCVVFHDALLSDIINVILPEAAYNALLAPFLFILFDRIYENELPREAQF